MNEKTTDIGRTRRSSVADILNFLNIGSGRNVNNNNNNNSRSSSNKKRFDMPEGEAVYNPPSEIVNYTIGDLSEMAPSTDAPTLENDSHWVFGHDINAIIAKGDKEVEGLVNIRNSMGETALHCVNMDTKVTSEYYQPMVLAGLLIDNYRAKIDILDNEGNNPLHSAVSYYQLAIGLNSTIEFKEKKLKETIALLNILFEHGCNSEVKNRAQLTPMAYLCLVAKKEEIQLAASNIEVEAFNNEYNKYSITTNIFGPLVESTSNDAASMQRSTSTGSEDGGKSSIRGVSIGSPSSSSRRFSFLGQDANNEDHVIFKYVREGRNAALQELLKTSDKDFVNMTNNKKQPLLHTVNQGKGNYEIKLTITQLLIGSKNVNLNCIDDKGNNALHAVIRSFKEKKYSKDEVESVKRLCDLLLSAGCDHMHNNYEQRLPMSYLCSTAEEIGRMRDIKIEGLSYFEPVFNQFFKSQRNASVSGKIDVNYL